MAIKTYSPRKVVVIWGGTPLTGYVDGTFVVVEANEDAFSLYVGADGEGSRVASANRSGKVRVTVKQTSASNDYLSSEHEIDRRTNVGGKPLIVEDTSGRSLYSAAEAWIVKAPNGEFGKEIAGREYTFETDDLTIFNGGN